MNGPPGEADQRNPHGFEGAGSNPDGLDHVRHVGRDVERPQPIEVSWTAERLLHDRPDTCADLHSEPDRRRGDHDVREEDRRVDAVATDRLERELGRQLRVREGVEDAA